MADQFHDLLQPRYVGQFHCIGPACEDNCCIGWRVDIDKDTFKRYRECSDATLRTQMDEKVTRNRSAASDAKYAKIKMKQDASCPFLNEDRFCAIQRRLGEEYLSVTCTTYPRITNIVNGRLEKSLTLSCPEAARLALLDSAPMSFDETEEEICIRNNRGKILESSDFQNTYKPERYFWELRIFIISLLQDRSYPLWQRLVILGLFCRRADQLVEEAKVQEIPQLIGTYLNYLDQNELKEELAAIPDELTLQMELTKELADQRFFEGVGSKRFLDCFAEFLNGIQYTAEATKEEIARRYAAAYNLYYQPLMEQHEYILENYLVNYVFRNLFPFSGQKHIFDNYVMLVVHYAMIKMLLIGMAGFHKEKFSIDHVLKLIQSFSKTVEHNTAYLKMVFELLQSNHFNTMPYMAILIKN